MCDLASEIIHQYPESYLWHHGRWGRLRNKDGTFKNEEERRKELPFPPEKEEEKEAPKSE